MSFSYSISGVPDLDQKWRLLPNHGNMYCVPAAAMNWMYYLAKHGRPGALTFQPPDTSNATSVILNILWMASYMDTDAEDGTSSDDAIDGLVDYLDDRNVPAIVLAESARDCGDITYTDIESWTALGGLVVVIMGRYKRDGNEMERTSGHAMSLVEFKRSGGAMLMSVHDPVDDHSDLNTQSPTLKRSAAISSEVRNLEGDVVNVLRWGESTDPYRFIDGLITIVPLFALTNPTARVLVQHSVDMMSGAVRSKEFRLPFDGELLDLAIHPYLPIASCIGRGFDQVWALDLVRGTWKRMVSAPSPERLIFGGRDRRLFVTHGRAISSFDKAGNPLGRIDMSDEIDAISYDARNDRLVLATSSAKRLVAVSPDLRVLGDIQAPEVPGQGRPALSVNGRDGTIVLSRAGTPRAATLRWQLTGARASGSFHLLTSESPGALHVDRKGELHAVEAGKIVAFDLDGNRVGSVLDGLSAGPILKVARSGHNFDPVRSRRKEWKNRGM